MPSWDCDHFDYPNHDYQGYNYDNFHDIEELLYRLYHYDKVNRNRHDLRLLHHHHLRALWQSLQRISTLCQPLLFFRGAHPGDALSR